MLTRLQTELWCEYSVGVAVFCLRFVARWRVVGFRHFAGDDAFACLAFVRGLDGGARDLKGMLTVGSFTGLLDDGCDVGTNYQ